MRLCNTPIETEPADKCGATTGLARGGAQRNILTRESDRSEASPEIATSPAQALAKHCCTGDQAAILLTAMARQLLPDCGTAGGGASA